MFRSYTQYSNRTVRGSASRLEMLPHISMQLVSWVQLAVLDRCTILV